MSFDSAGGAALLQKKIASLPTYPTVHLGSAPVSLVIALTVGCRLSWQTHALIWQLYGDSYTLYIALLSGFYSLLCGYNHVYSDAWLPLLSFTN